jgi:hypothetical protein
MSDLLLLDAPAILPPPPLVARTGLVRAEHKVVRDDAGVFHPLGLTFFWGVYGWKYERPRVLDHLAWLQPKGYDYLRILAEVDWVGRSIEPWAWPDYAEQLCGFVDAAYDHGLRSEVTIVGGCQFDQTTGARRFVPTDLARQVATALVGREAKIMHYEMANEWFRLDKVTPADLMDMTRVVDAISPNLVSLSCPESDGAEQLREATKAAAGSSYTIHPRRSDHDHGWSHVRQGYDFKDFPAATWNNEPEGPQSSVEAMSDPLQLACCRLLGILCGGAGYVLHVGQGVTGVADPAHGRPQNMWEVPNIDAIMATVRACDALLPDGIENWTCVNNGRDTHPLPLPGDSGFWEGDHPGPSVNKNYAAINGADFVVILTGVKSAGATGPVPAGTARKAMHVEAFDPVTHARIAVADLAAGQGWTLPGRGDTMAAWLVRGRYV